jgi:rifampin ADP-ribosylating transferase
MTVTATPFAQTFFHGAKADLQVGDLLKPGFASNFGAGKPAGFVYVAGTLDAAVWGAELALGEGPGRIYVVEPTGPLEDDPNLTDKKFPGNPTLSYRARDPVRILGEVVGWQGHAPEALEKMRRGVAEARRLEIEAIE